MGGPYISSWHILSLTNHKEESYSLQFHQPPSSKNPDFWSHDRKHLTRKLTFHRPRCLQGPSAAASADRCPVKTHKLISAHQHHPWIIFVWHNLSILDLVHVGSCGMLPLWKEELLPSSGSLRPEPSSEKRWKQILSSIFHPFITDETGKEISPFWWRWHKGIQPSLPSQCSPWGRHSSPVTFVNVNPNFEFSFLILSRWWQLMSNRWHWTNQWVATVKEQKVSYCGEALRWIGRALDQVDIGPSLKKFMRQRQLLECECTVTRLSDMNEWREGWSDTLGILVFAHRAQGKEIYAAIVGM